MPIVIKQGAKYKYIIQIHIYVCDVNPKFVGKKQQQKIQKRNDAEELRQNSNGV